MGAGSGVGGRKRALLAALLLWPAPGVALAQTLDETLASAEANNPLLEEARLGVRAARENRAQAFAGYLPQVDVTASYGSSRVVTEQPDFLGRETRSVQHTQPLTTTARVTQQLYTGGRRGGQMRLARATHESAQESLRSTEQGTVLSAIDAFLRVRRDVEIARLREGHVASLTQQLDGTQRRLDVGEVTRTDLAQAQARLAGARAALANARSDLEASRANFVEVVGMDSSTPAPLPPPPETPATLDEAIALAENSHPDILEAEQNARGARARVTIDRAALLPQLSVVGRADRASEQDFVNQDLEGESALAQVSIPLFEGGFSWSRTRQSRINASRAEQIVAARRREVTADVISRWNALSASREVLDAAHEQVSASALALEGAEREQGLGLRSTIDVLDAERDWQDAQIALARADAQAAIADYALLAAVGGLTFDAARSGA